MTTNDLLTGPLTIPLLEEMPAYDATTARLGFSTDNLCLTPRPVTKRQRHRVRVAARKVQDEICGTVNP